MGSWGLCSLSVGHFRSSDVLFTGVEAEGFAVAVSPFRNQPKSSLPFWMIIGWENEGKYKKFEFEEEEIIKNQNNFFNLIFSGSLFDKKKAIFINRTTDKLFNLISEISKKNVEDILIFFKADQLEKKSKIRNLFEKDKNLVCVACYQDNNFDLIKIINDEIKQTKIKLSTESINLLIERADGDRNNLRNEINKLKSLAISKNIISHEQVQELTNMAKNYQNDFQWEYDSSHLEYVKCEDVEAKFEKVDNGIMLNCFPEHFLIQSPTLFKIIKEF